MAAPAGFDRTVELFVGDPDFPVLNAFIGSNAGVQVIRGPLGSGKTTGAICKLMRHMIEQPANAEGVRPTRVLAIRNTYPDLTGTTIKDFLEIFGEVCRMRYGGKEPPTATVGFWLEDGTRVESEVIFLALDRDDATKKLRGYQVTMVWINEAKEIGRAIMSLADLRHGRFPKYEKHGVDCGWHGMILDTNSWDEEHYLFEIEASDPEDWAFFHQPGGVLRDGVNEDGSVRWRLNPHAENLKNLPDGYYRRGMQGKTDAWIAVNLANEYGFVVDGVPVWLEYRDDAHCPKEPIPFNPEWPIRLGIDFGRTPAAAIFQTHPVLARHYVIDEFCATSVSASLFGPALRRYIGATYPGAEVEGWGDPAGDQPGEVVEQTAIAMLKGSGLPVRAAPVDNRDLLKRRNAVIEPLTRSCMDGKPALWISRKCKMLRKGAAGGFHFRKLKVGGDDRFTETPEKNQYSHVCEGLEYGLLGAGEGRAVLRNPAWSHGPRQEYAEV